VAPAKVRTLRLRVFIDASPKKVFRSISDPERLTRWMVDAATLSPRRRGRYSFTWEGGPTHTGKVLEFVRGKSLTLTWQWPGKEEQLTTRLKMSVQAESGGTVLKFIHSGFPKGEQWFDLYAGAVQGWTYFMMNLKSVLEHDHDLRSPLDW
jgi:uncharacterized protein YndB with AHSA1/START domain